jgi:hypothetical protein
MDSSLNLSGFLFLSRAGQRAPTPAAMLASSQAKLQHDQLPLLNVCFINY